MGIAPPGGSCCYRNQEGDPLAIVPPTPAVLPTNAAPLPRLLAYAQALEAGHLPVERPLGRPGLGGALGWGVAEGV